MEGETVKAHIRGVYAKLAKRPRTGPCCDVTKLAGYSEAQLEAVPAAARMAAAGCGNPTALAGLKPGEVVLDLGSGAGLDALLAAELVGLKGRAIGVDMTPEMVEQARANAAEMGLRNVEFKVGEVEALPLPDASVDVVISNCVINLAPDKERVFREAYRVLKPGGRLVVSDIMVQGLPEALRGSLTALTACIGGAVSLEAYLDAIRSAGFMNVKVVDQHVYPRAMMQSLARTLLSLGRRRPTQPQERQKTGVDTAGLEVMHAEVEAWR